MSKTKAQVKEHAADILGIKPVGQDIQQPASRTLDKYWDAAYDEVKSDNLNIFPSSGPIPDKLFHHFAMIIAQKGAVSFSVSDARYQRIVMESQRAMREFRKYAVDSYESIDQVVDF